MNVAIVINASWNIFNFRRGLIQAMQDKGYRVTAIAPEDNYSTRLVELGCKYIPVKMASQGVNPLSDLLLIRRLLKIYKKEKPDIILHYTIKPNIYGSIAAGLLKIPVVNNVSGLGTVFIKENLLSKISRTLYRFAFRFADKVFFQNQDDLNLFLDYNLVKQNKTDLLPGSGVDLSYYKPAIFSRNEPFVFLMISRIIEDKGIREYINAIKRMHAKGKKAKFTILGALDPHHKRGISIQEFDGWKNQGLIEYLGKTDDVRPYIASADCILLPSYREGTPKTLLEAAAMGKPLIATNVPGCREIVYDKVNGLLCEVKSDNELALKMEEMIDYDDGKLKEMGIKSRELVVEKFNENIVFKKYLETIRNLTAEKKGEL